MNRRSFLKAVASICAAANVPLEVQQTIAAPKSCGYIEAPNGFVIAWGVSEGSNVTFPYTFRHTPHIIASYDTEDELPQYTNYSCTGFSIQDKKPFHYIAIGIGEGYYGLLSEDFIKGHGTTPPRGFLNEL